ncbi:MAG: hypothetical protein ACHQUC_01435 [Chlamydiales bacterium]
MNNKILVFKPRKKRGLMKTMTKTVLGMFVLMMAMLTFKVFAQDVPVDPSAFLQQLTDAFKSFGGLTGVAKIALIITLLVSSMKVTILNQLIWSKLGAAQTWLAPVLGLVGGILGIGSGGAPITLASVLVFLSAGVGAVAFHELLDSLKAIPGIGSVVVSIINVIESVLGGAKK